MSVDDHTKTVITGEQADETLGGADKASTPPPIDESEAKRIEEEVKKSANPFEALMKHPGIAKRIREGGTVSKIVEGFAGRFPSLEKYIDPLDLAEGSRNIELKETEDKYKKENAPIDAEFENHKKRLEDLISISSRANRLKIEGFASIKLKDLLRYYSSEMETAEETEDRDERIRNKKLVIENNKERIDEAESTLQRELVNIHEQLSKRFSTLIDCGLWGKMQGWAKIKLLTDSYAIKIGENVRNNGIIIDRCEQLEVAVETEIPKLIANNRKELKEHIEFLEAEEDHEHHEETEDTEEHASAHGHEKKLSEKLADLEELSENLDSSDRIDKAVFAMKELSDELVHKTEEKTKETKEVYEIIAESLFTVDLKERGMAARAWGLVSEPRKIRGLRSVSSSARIRLEGLKACKSSTPGKTPKYRIREMSKSRETIKAMEAVFKELEDRRHHALHHAKELAKDFSKDTETMLGPVKASDVKEIEDEAKIICDHHKKLKTADEVKEFLKLEAKIKELESKHHALHVHSLKDTLTEANAEHMPELNEDEIDKYKKEYEKVKKLFEPPSKFLSENAKKKWAEAKTAFEDSKLSYAQKHDAIEKALKEIKMMLEGDKKATMLPDGKTAIDLEKLNKIFSGSLKKLEVAIESEETKKAEKDPTFLEGKKTIKKNIETLRSNGTEDIKTQRAAKQEEIRNLQALLTKTTDTGTIAILTSQVQSLNSELSSVSTYVKHIIEDKVKIEEEKIKDLEEENKTTITKNVSARMDRIHIIEEPKGSYLYSLKELGEGESLKLDTENANSWTYSEMKKIMRNAIGNEDLNQDRKEFLEALGKSVTEAIGETKDGTTTHGKLGDIMHTHEHNQKASKEKFEKVDKALLLALKDLRKNGGITFDDMEKAGKSINIVNTKLDDLNKQLGELFNHDHDKMHAFLHERLHALQHQSEHAMDIVTSMAKDLKESSESMDDIAYASKFNDIKAKMTKLDEESLLTISYDKDKKKEQTEAMAVLLMLKKSKDPIRLPEGKLSKFWHNRPWSSTRVTKAEVKRISRRNEEFINILSGEKPAIFDLGMVRNFVRIFTAERRGGIRNGLILGGYKTKNEKISEFNSKAQELKRNVIPEIDKKIAAADNEPERVKLTHKKDRILAEISRLEAKHHELLEVTEHTRNQLRSLGIVKSMREIPIHQAVWYSLANSFLGVIGKSGIKFARKNIVTSASSAMKAEADEAHHSHHDHEHGAHSPAHAPAKMPPKTDHTPPPPPPKAADHGASAAAH